MVPVAGSAYTYAYATLGELFAWIIGWDLILEYAMASSAVAVGWSKYFVEFLTLFGIHLSPRVFMDPQSYLTTFGGPALADVGLWESFKLTFTGQVPFSCDWVAVGILVIVTMILVKGIRESAGANTLIVFVKLFVVLYVIVMGSRHIDVSNWHPYFPFGWKGVMTGAGFIFFAYIGFDSISTHAEEAKNPQRDVPIAILASLFFCTILYIAVAAVLTGMVKFSAIDIHAPLASAFANYGMKPAVLLISFGALAGLTSVLLVMMLSQARIFLAMARDRLLPHSFFGKIHPRFRTPHYSTMLTGFVVALVAGLTPIGKIAELVNIGTLLAFVIVCAAVLVLRKREPERHRPFKCPWVPVVPILGILSNVALMLSLNNVTKLRLVVWLAIGFVIYFLYGRRKSEFYAKTRIGKTVTGKPAN
jgi:APA family basic amino acid/polyamine antiporter